MNFWKEGVCQPVRNLVDHAVRARADAASASQQLKHGLDLGVAVVRVGDNEVVSKEDVDLFEPRRLAPWLGCEQNQKEVIAELVNLGGVRARREAVFDG